MINNSKGVSLYLALTLTALLLAMVLGLSAIFLGQLGVVRGMGDSVIALYAADTGIERVLYDGVFLQPSYSGSLNGSSYQVTITQPLGGEILGIPRDSNCSASYFCIRSVGKFGKVNRAIEVRR